MWMIAISSLGCVHLCVIPIAKNKKVNIRNNDIVQKTMGNISPFIIIRQILSLFFQIIVEL